MSILHISKSSLYESSLTSSIYLLFLKFYARTRSSFSGKAIGAPNFPEVFYAINCAIAAFPLAKTPSLYSWTCCSKADPFLAFGILADERSAVDCFSYLCFLDSCCILIL